MRKSHSPERIAVLIFATARTALCAYRAATQSITVDEATTYLNYVRDHWANVWTNYDPNNHILYSILAQLSVRAFHISEFTLRLPSVLAGFFFIVGLYRVLEETVSSRAIRGIALLAFGTAPLLLDFSVAARGYGLSLALLVWAIYSCVTSHSKRHDVCAGVLLGLSLAANFNIAFPALGLIAFRRGSLALILPAAAIFGTICYPLLGQIHSGQLYIGAPTIGAAAYELVYTFIRAVPGHPGLFGAGTGAHAVEYFFLPAVLVSLIAVSVRGKQAPQQRLPVIVLLISLASIVAAHFLAGMNYPVDRMGLALFVLFGLAWTIAADQIPNPRVRALNAVLAILLIAQFLTQWHTRYFDLWLFDLPSKQVAQRLLEESRGKASGSVSVSATWFQIPAIEYYRQVNRIAALQPIQRHEHTQLDGFDYYVLNAKDDDDLKGRPLPEKTLLFQDDLSGVFLFK